MSIGVLTLALCLSVSVVSTDETTSPVPILSHAKLSAELAALASTHPEVVQLLSIGSSREGRAIELLRIAGKADTASQPAILLVAGLEGPRVFESGVALSHAQRLAGGYAQNEDIRELLDGTVVYILPRANPDAAEARFRTPRIEQTTGGHAIDNDRDGRSGEDGPQDVNGDGQVTWMRVVDPEGEWIADPADERVLVKADPKKGERGRWKLHREGRDLDGDESVAEDPRTDTLLNRSFPAGWDELAADAGLYPSDEPEAQALMNFVHAHPELAMVIAYDAIDNLVKEPQAVADDAPSVKRIPPPGWLQSDADLLKELGVRYKTHVEKGASAEVDDAGSFQRWSYEHRGLWTLCMRLWQLPDEAQKSDDASAEEEGESAEGESAAAEESEKPSEEGDGEKEGDENESSQDAKHLSWIDAAEGEGWRFVDWTAFEHPELGAVEIGGFAPFARFEPPAAAGREIANQQFAFLLTLGELLPRVSLVGLTSESLGDGLWRVEAIVESGSSLLPLRSKSAARTRTVRPARVRIELPEGATMLAGSRQQLLRELSGAGGRSEFQWLLGGTSGMQINLTIDTDNAGLVRQSLEVK